MTDSAIMTERARIAGIMAHPKAATQRALAAHVIEAGYEADMALKILDAASEPQQAATNPFIAAMTATTNPAVNRTPRQDDPNENEGGVFA